MWGGGIVNVSYSTLGFVNIYSFYSVLLSLVHSVNSILYSANWRNQFFNLQKENMDEINVLSINV